MEELRNELRNLKVEQIETDKLAKILERSSIPNRKDLVIALLRGKELGIHHYDIEDAVQFLSIAEIEGASILSDRSFIMSHSRSYSIAGQSSDNISLLDNEQPLFVNKSSSVFRDMDSLGPQGERRQSQSFSSTHPKKFQNTMAFWNSESAEPDLSGDSNSENPFGSNSDNARSSHLLFETSIPDAMKKDASFENRTPLNLRTMILSNDDSFSKRVSFEPEDPFGTPSSFISENPLEESMDLKSLSPAAEKSENEQEKTAFDSLIPRPSRSPKAAASRLLSNYEPFAASPLHHSTVAKMDSPSSSFGNQSHEYPYSPSPYEQEFRVTFILKQESESPTHLKRKIKRLENMLGQAEDRCGELEKNCDSLSNSEQQMRKQAIELKSKCSTLVEQYTEVCNWLT
jgi:hypothetical protein